MLGGIVAALIAARSVGLPALRLVASLSDFAAAYVRAQLLEHGIHPELVLQLTLTLPQPLAHLQGLFLTRSPSPLFHPFLRSCAETSLAISSLISFLERILIRQSKSRPSNSQQLPQQFETALKLLILLGSMGISPSTTGFEAIVSLLESGEDSPAAQLAVLFLFCCKGLLSFIPAVRVSGLLEKAKRVGSLSALLLAV